MVQGVTQFVLILTAYQQWNIAALMWFGKELAEIVDTGIMEVMM